MEDWNKLKNRALAGKDADALRALASTPEAQRLSGSSAALSLREAVERGDSQGVQRALSALLSTREGDALRRRVEHMGQGHG